MVNKEHRDRKSAIEAGARHYFTGLPCKRGHVAPRYTDTCNCVECMKMRVYQSRDAIRAKREK